MIIVRFSRDGFSPKNQSYHRDMLLRYKNSNADEEDPNLTPFTNQIIRESVRECQKLLQNVDLQDWEQGVFVFLDGLPSQYERRLELNNITPEEAQNRRWFSGEIPQQTKVYSVYGIIPQPYTAQELVNLVGKGVPAYLPNTKVDNVSGLRSLTSQIS